MGTFRNQLIVWLIKNYFPIFLRIKKWTTYSIAEDEKFWRLFIQMKRDGRYMQQITECYNLWQLACNVQRLTGDWAEVGVFRGGSAKIICELKGDDQLHLCDTFSGMPEVTPAFDGIFTTGSFNDTSLESVQDYLKNYRGVFFYKGFFPDSVTGKVPEVTKFKFVHLDVDIYESTKQSLEFFYPRMIRGGVIVSHDYNSLHAPGVKKAFTEFLSDKEETLIPLWDTQCVLVKI